MVDRGGQDGQENEYVMKAIMRLLTVVQVRMRVVCGGVVSVCLRIHSCCVSICLLIDLLVGLFIGGPSCASSHRRAGARA